MGAGRLITKGLDKLRKSRSKKDVQGTLSGKDRAASDFKRKEFLESTPRYSDGRPIPQLEPVGKLKGNLMKDLKKYSDKNPIQPPSPITQKVQLPNKKLFDRKPVQ